MHGDCPLFSTTHRVTLAVVAAALVIGPVAGETFDNVVDRPISLKRMKRKRKDKKKQALNKSSSASSAKSENSANCVKTNQPNLDDVSKHVKTPLPRRPASKEDLQ